MLGEVTTATCLQPQWNAGEVERGYAVSGRPAFPVMDCLWIPSAEQRQQPLRSALAAAPAIELKEYDRLRDQYTQLVQAINRRAD